MRRHHLLALTAALLAASTASAAGQEPGTAAAPHEAAPGETLVTLDGVVRAVDLGRHEVTLDVDGSPVVLGLDRNTLVYLPAGLSTVFALRPGEVVRAGRNGASLAYWIQVRSPGGGAVPSTPGQGTGPGGGAAPPAEGPAPGPVTR